jgi:hypothetical protein
MRSWSRRRRLQVRDSRYNSGPGNDWVKKTCDQRETLPIAGFALKENKFDGLYVGRHKGDDLVFAGKVDHGFDSASAKDLQVLPIPFSYGSLKALARLSGLKFANEPVIGPSSVGAGPGDRTIRARRDRSRRCRG